jgi:ElaB/YqjD/DUF883 family membrane-anchored ribosome-binding protein
MEIRMPARHKSQTTKHIGKRLGTLRSDIAALQDDMKGLADTAGDAANDSARLAAHAAENIAQRAYQLAEEAVAEVADEVETWGNENLDTVRESVRTQPLSAVFLAMGMGALLGSVFLRR